MVEDLMTRPPKTDLIPAWEHGKLVPVGKLRAHAEGIKHKAVSVFVVDGDQILLQRRAAEKYHTPGLWANTCCTHPHWEEPPLECAHRRLKEEMGITGLNLISRGSVEYRASVGGGMTEHEVVDLFIAQVSSADLKIEPNPAEVMDIRWINLTQLTKELSSDPETFTPWLRIYMARHQAQLFGAD